MESQNSSRPELALLPNNTSLVPYTPQPSSYADSIWSAASNALYALSYLPSYLSPPAISPEEAERQRKFERISDLSKRIAKTQELEIEKKQIFEGSWKAVLDSQIHALTLNSEAFDVLLNLLESIIKFVVKISANRDFFSHCDDLSIIHNTSPLIETVHALKEQVQYFTTGIQSTTPYKRGVIGTESYSTLDLINDLQDTWKGVLKYELERIKTRIEGKIHAAVNNGSEGSSVCSTENLKTFDTVDLAFSERKEIENELNKYFSFLNQQIPHFLNIELETEDSTASKSSFLGWFGSKGSQPHEAKALPEYTKKHLISKYNEINEKTVKALEDFRHKLALLNTHAEELKSVIFLLKDLRKAKNNLQFISGISECSDLESDGEEEEEQEKESPLVNPLISQVSNQYLAPQINYGTPSIYDTQNYFREIPPSGYGERVEEDSSGEELSEGEN